MLLSQEAASLLIIGAYRDNEVDALHPLRAIINEAKSTFRDRVTQISLQPLSLRHIAQLLSDSFHSSEADVTPVAQLLLSRTQGNPFFITQLLRSYYDSGLLRFDFDAERWLWDVDAMQRAPVQEDVVELVCRQMQTLSEDAQIVLQYAACIGNRMSMHSLAIVTQLGRLPVALLELERASMLLCVEHGHDLLMLAQVTGCTSTPPADLVSIDVDAFPGSDANPLPAGSTESAADLEVGDAGATSTVEPKSATSLHQCSPAPDSQLRLIVLKFAHDRVQAAALKLIPADRISGVHCAIVSLLIANLSGNELDKHAVDICGHINSVGLAVYCDDEPSDPTAADPAAHDDCWSRFFAQSGMVDCVIALEKSAGRQAKGASAYDSAIGFFSAALRLLQRRNKSSLTERECAAGSGESDRSSFALTVQPPASGDQSTFPRVSASCWSSSHAPCLRLYKELCECFFLSSSYATAVECLEYVLSVVTVLLERANFFEVRTAAAH